MNRAHRGSMGREFPMDVFPSKRRCITRWAVFALLWGFAFFPGVAVGAAPTLDDDRAMIEGLLSRQLFELAELYAAQQIVAEVIGPRHQAEMAAELIRAYTLHAMSARQSERQRWWEAAAAVAPQFEKQFPGQKALPLVQVQDAVSQLSRVRLLRQEGEVLGEADKTAEAQWRIAETLQRLEQLQQTVDEALRQSHQATDGNAALGSDELLALSRRVTLHRAEAWEEQGLCYERDSLDRTNAMAQAVRQVETLTPLRPETGVLWPALLLEIRALRGLSRLDEAAAKVAHLRQRQPPPQMLLAAQAEEIRIALDRDDLKAAAKMIEQPREIDGVISPELDFACFETYLALWKAAEAQDQAEEVKLWQNRAATVVRELDHLHGAYWARRAEQRLTGSASSGGTENLDLIRRTAEGYARQKRWDEAIKNYDLGAQAAAQSNLTEAEYALRLSAAAAAIEAGKVAEGARRFREAAVRFPAAEDAPLRHLTAAYYQSMLARETNPPELEPYIELLKENLQRWPSGEAAQQAAMWLGQIEFSRGNWREATEAYLLVPPESAHFPQAVDGVRQSALKWFQAAEARDELVPQDVQKVIQYFEQIIVSGQMGADQWTAPMRLAAETAAQLWLSYTPKGYDNARAVLEVALRSDSDAPQGWRNRLESLRVIALAGLGRLEEAEANLRQASTDSPAHLFEVLQALGQIGNSASPIMRQQIARLELRVVELLRPNLNQLDDITRQAIQIREAEALATSGALEAGIEHYQQLAQAQPTNFEIQQGLARMLSRGTTAAFQQQALDRWRWISSKSRAQSPAWYEAKLEIARCHLRLGDPRETVKMIQYLQTLYPDLGGLEFRGQFVELLQQAMSS